MTQNDIEDLGKIDKCIYNNDHDIVDHQTCLFDYGTHNAIFSVCMYNEKSNRTMEIRGTRGWITIDYAKNTVTLKQQNKQIQTFNTETAYKTGHKGSDTFFLQKVIEHINSNVVDDILFEEAIKCTTTCINLNNTIL